MSQGNNGIVNAQSLLSIEIATAVGKCKLPKNLNVWYIFREKVSLHLVVSEHKGFYKPRMLEARVFNIGGEEQIIELIERFRKDYSEGIYVNNGKIIMEN